jgi:hypothetical protein
VGAGCRRWYTRGGWAKREAEVMRGADEDMDDDAGAMRGAGGGVGGSGVEKSKVGCGG